MTAKEELDLIDQEIERLRQKKASVQRAQKLTFEPTQDWVVSSPADGFGLPDRYYGRYYGNILDLATRFGGNLEFFPYSPTPDPDVTPLPNNRKRVLIRVGGLDPDYPKTREDAETLLYLLDKAKIPNFLISKGDWYETVNVIPQTQIVSDD